jgi:hypothetical protein
MLSAAPGLAPPVNRALTVLVIADPAPEPELQLAGARQEGREVVQVLDRFKRHHDLELEIVERISAIERDPVDILALILNSTMNSISSILRLTGSLMRRPQPAVDGSLAKTVLSRRGRSSGLGVCRSWSSRMPAFPPW